VGVGLGSASVSPPCEQALRLTLRTAAAAIAIMVESLRKV